MPRETECRDEHDDIVYPSAIPFALVHVACLAAFWTGVTFEAVIIGIAIYWLRVFAITARYHRYFSHRAFSSSRPFQLVLAVLAQSTAQKSVLWWAAKHRHHHVHSDRRSTCTPRSGKACSADRSTTRALLLEIGFLSRAELAA